MALSFPNEVWLEVARKIESVEDLVALSSTNKQLNKIAHQERIWNNLFSLYKNTEWRYLNPICHYDSESSSWTEEELEDLSSVSEPDRTLLNAQKSLPSFDQFKFFYSPPTLQHLRVGEALQVQIYSRGCWHSSNYTWVIERTRESHLPYENLVITNSQNTEQSSSTVFPLDTEAALELEPAIWSAIHFVKPNFYSTSRVTITIVKKKKDGSEVQLANLTSPSHRLYDYLAGYR